MMRTAILTILILSGPMLHGQQRNSDRSNGGRRASIGGGLEIGIPLGAFRDTWGRELVGLSGTVALPMRWLPFHWGFDFGWGHMGGDRKDIILNDPAFQGTTGSLSVNSNVYSYHGLLRFQPITGKVSPYFEGLAGIRHFSTRSKMRVEGASEPLEKQRNSSNFIGSAGWAAGVQVAPAGAFYVEGRIERLNGGNATYVDPRTIAIGADGEVTYGTLSSPTRSVQVQLGIGLRF